MYDVYLNPEEVIHPIAIVLEAAQLIALDPEAEELANDLIAWVQETAARSAAARRSASRIVSTEAHHV